MKKLRGCTDRRWVKREALGQDHPDTLASMNSLATVLDSQRKYKEAEETYRETVELREKVLGKEHQSTLGSMNNLALALQRQDKYNEAEEIHRRVLGLYKKVLSEEHPDALTSMNNLAGVLGNQGNYVESRLDIYHFQTQRLETAVILVASH
jgi:tetratricopeptide (TPR) repeat protein